jgi:S-disulfanyl-L-cysteine oxidoreductase SoxD
MPYREPGSLSPHEVYSVTAYVLYLDGIVSESEVLNAKSLSKVKMPNRNGFVPDPRPDTRKKQPH